MKKIVLVLMVFSTLIFAQEKNKMSVDEKTGKPMLVGVCDRSAFADTSFSWWFDSEHDNYTPDSAAVKEIGDKLNDIKITIVMGTWCSDSHREVPRFFKILDQLNYDQKNITLICVDRKKSAPSGDVDKLNIELVPTMIFYKDDKEIGRVIESPKESLEKDILKILLK